MLCDGDEVILGNKSVISINENGKIIKCLINHNELP